MVDSWGQVFSDKVPWVLAGCLNLCACTPQDAFDLGEPRDCNDPVSQNEWVYGAMQKTYLWAEELPEVDPAVYESPKALIADLRHGPDNWSRVSDLAKTTALFEKGKVISYGYSTRRTDDGRLLISAVRPESSAGRAGLRRGQEIVTAGGYTVAQLDEQSRWSEVNGEQVPGVTVELGLVDVEQGDLNVTLTKDWVDIVTVPHYDVFELAQTTVGYIAFTTFVDTAYDELDAAFADFKAAGVRDVVVDLRYNGGGRIAVARHLMNLLVGATAGGALAYDIEHGPGLADENYGRSLSQVDHSLEATRSVTFITTRTTFSASELVINALRPHTEVRIVGTATGGKPVGSRHYEFCGTSILAPITFRLRNADEVSDYFEGLAPTCVAQDDLTRELGDPDESSIRAALSLISNDTCEVEVETAPPTRQAQRRLDPADPERFIVDL